MNRLSSRLLKIFGVIISLLVLYWIAGRIFYERLLNRLYITFEDFPPDYADILKELPQHPGDNTELQAYNYSSLPSPDPASHISSIIHFIHFLNLYETHETITTIPSEVSHAPSFCEREHPDFQIIIWNETASYDLLEAHYGWFLPTYASYSHPIQRIDAMKYFIIYHFGGFYLDLDISCRRSLQPLQQFPAWLPRASPQGLNNDAMAARARHPAWKTMIDMLKPRNKSLVFPYLTVFWSTGPQFATDMVKQYLDENPRHKEYVPGASKANADPDDIFILPQEFYSEQYTFFGHSPGGTWHEGDVGVFVWLIDRPWVGIVVISLLLAIVFLAYPALRPGRDLLRTRWGQYKQVQQDEELADFSASDSER